MFSNILLAVDLSKAPEKAYRHALNLSNQLGAKLQLAYVFHPKQLKGWLRSSKKPKNLKTYFQNRLQLLKPIKNDKEVPTALSELAQIPKKVIQGFPEEELLQLIRQEEIELILVNIDAFSYPFNEDFGKVVSTISIDSSCPVLLLPSDSVSIGFKKILFVADWKYFQQDQLEYMVGLAYLFNAEIHVLHVLENKASPDLERNIEKQLDALALGIPINFQKVDPQLLVEGINAYLGQTDIQLVNFISVRRYFWSDFLKNQMKNSYRLNKDLPILINYFEEN